MAAPQPDPAPEQVPGPAPAPSGRAALARVPRPRDPAALDALIAHAREDQRARPRAARVLADVIDQLLDERLAATATRG